MIMIAHTSFIVILPDGSSRSAVLGFLASISLSTRLLSAIAALLAPRNASPTQNNMRSSGITPLVMRPARKPKVSKRNGEYGMLQYNEIRIQFQFS